MRQAMMQHPPPQTSILHSANLEDLTSLTSESVGRKIWKESRYENDDEEVLMMMIIIIK